MHGGKKKGVGRNHGAPSLRQLKCEWEGRGGTRFILSTKKHELWGHMRRQTKEGGTYLPEQMKKKPWQENDRSRKEKGEMRGKARGGETILLSFYSSN